MRGFEKAKGYSHLEFELPKRQTKHSAGYDLAIIEDLVISPGEIKLGVTGVKAFMGNDEVLKLYPRSSLPRKYHLTIPNNVGIIDSDYYSNEENDGAIYVQLFNFGKETITLKKGERIAQGIFQKYLISNLEETILKTRNGGFGSTD
ncbi:deoxyuridine 5'-triphosphate nucleotidohydrolase [Candidatus Izimaplasma bacterium ZiA1]|nr:deoxyuridine 5'-triphosphate nucleotidohydrolase [Candidatus Izimaplasma bacterium ZiA1]